MPEDIRKSCIEWTKGKDSNGYGVLWIQRKPYRVHVLACEEFHGPRPPGLMALHKCDNPPCYNPDHLFWGTKAQNTKDSWDRGWRKWKEHHDPTTRQ